MGDLQPLRPGQLGAEISALQRQLTLAGFSTPVSGTYDDATHRSVAQAYAGMLERGAYAQAGPELRCALAAEESARTRKLLPGMRGHVGYLIRWEGHEGTPFVPVDSRGKVIGASGLTLDPGLDLGQSDARSLDVYRRLLGDSALAALRPWLGVRGEPALRALRDPRVTAIRIGELAASRLLPDLAQRFWRRIIVRWPVLLDPSTPRAVQTACLSLTYNRGHANSKLDVLNAPLALRDWSRAADAIEAMKHEHRDQGLKDRRCSEAMLIRGGIS